MHDKIWDLLAKHDPAPFADFKAWALGAGLPGQLGPYYAEKVGTWAEDTFRTFKALRARGVQFIGKSLAVPEARTMADLFEAAALVPQQEGGRTYRESLAHVTREAGGEGFIYMGGSRSKCAPSVYIGGRRRWSDNGHRWRNGKYTSIYAKPVAEVWRWWGGNVHDMFNREDDFALAGFEFVERDDGILAIARTRCGIGERWIALLDKGETLVSLLSAADQLKITAEAVADFAAWEDEAKKPEGAPINCADCYVIREADGKMTRHWSQDASQRYMDEIGVRSRGVQVEHWGFYDGRALLITAFGSEPPPVPGTTPVKDAPKPAAPAVKGSKAIAGDVLSVLADAETKGDKLYLQGKIDRPLYVATDAVLKALGGKWNRKEGAHVFDGDAGDLLGAVLESGSYVDMKKALQAFYTPRPLAERVIERADIKSFETVLEPSAGGGALALAARDAGGFVTCMEVDAGAAEKLEAMGFTCAVGDFLAETPDYFDKVVMNPPFSGGQDVRHVMHAAKFVRPGGRLVAIMSPGAIHRQTEPFKSFQAWAQERGAEVEHIAAGTFKESGTEVATIIVTVDL